MGNAKIDLASPCRCNFLSAKTSERVKELREKVLKLALLDESLFFGDQTAKSWYENRKTGFSKMHLLLNQLKTKTHDQGSEAIQ